MELNNFLPNIKIVLVLLLLVANTATFFLSEQSTSKTGLTSHGNDNAMTVVDNSKRNCDVAVSDCMKREKCRRKMKK